MTVPAPYGIVAALVMLAAGGCVERRLSITSEPSGALVTLGDNEVGRTPLETTFKFHGKYDVLVTLDGYEPMRTTSKASAPVYEYPGPDLIAEILPLTFHNTQHWHYVLEPRLEDSIPKPELEAGMVDRALQLREQLAQTKPPPPPKRPWLEGNQSAKPQSAKPSPETDELAEHAQGVESGEPVEPPASEAPVAPPVVPMGTMTPVAPNK